MQTHTHTHTHTHKYTPKDMHRWQEERKHPLGEYKAGKKGWQSMEDKKKGEAHIFLFLLRGSCHLQQFPSAPAQPVADSRCVCVAQR